MLKRKKNGIINWNERRQDKQFEIENKLRKRGI